MIGAAFSRTRATLFPRSVLVSPNAMEPESPFNKEPELFPRSKSLALTGVLLLTFPLFGAISVLIALVRAFGILQAAGSADPQALAADISQALISTLIGLVFGLIGLVIVNIALFKRTNRESWFYQSVIVLSVLWCVLLFPLGLIPGVLLFHHFSKRKNEFSA